MGILPVRARRSQSAGLRGTAKQRVGACARGGAKEDLAAGCIQVSASVISYRRVCRQSVEPQAPRLKTCPPFAFPKTIARCYAVGVCVCVCVRACVRARGDVWKRDAMCDGTSRSL